METEEIKELKAKIIKDFGLKPMEYRETSLSEQIFLEVLFRYMF